MPIVEKWIKSQQTFIIFFYSSYTRACGFLPGILRDKTMNEKLRIIHDDYDKQKYLFRRLKSRTDEKVCLKKVLKPIQNNIPF